MAALTYPQIQELWIANKGDPKAAPTMAAIALAESGGRTDALNDTPATGDYSVGLWQINYYGSLRPGRTASYGTPEALRADPNAQARAAKAISGNGRNFNPWTTYTTRDPNRSYKRFMGPAVSSGGGGVFPDIVGAITNPTAAVAGIVSSAVGGVGTAASAGLNWLTGGTIGAVSTVGDAAMAFVRFLGVVANPELWRRLGMILAGVLVIGLGLTLINRDAIAPIVKEAAMTAAVA